MSFDPVQAVSRPRYRMENRDQEIAPTDIGIESVWEIDRDGVRDREISHRHWVS